MQQQDALARLIDPAHICIGANGALVPSPLHVRFRLVSMARHLITGGAGFIGVNLVARLLAEGHDVCVVDDLSQAAVGAGAMFESDPRIDFFKIDCADEAALDAAFSSLGGIDEVWHLAANSDIPAGVTNPRVDLHRTFMTTFSLLSVMRKRGVRVLHFASSSAIYGDFGDVEIHEAIGPCEPISNYGAMKLASEAQIRAAHEGWLARANIFRFPNVIGVPATHGVIFDFCRKLAKTPQQLVVFGDGSQQKCYLDVADLIDAMLHIRRLEGAYTVFNIGPGDSGVTVREIAEAVRDVVSPCAEIVYGAEKRGWVGDVPRFQYSIARLVATGWTPSLSSEQAVCKAVRQVAAQGLD